MTSVTLRAERKSKFSKRIYFFVALAFIVAIGLVWRVTVPNSTPNNSTQPVSVPVEGTQTR